MKKWRLEEMALQHIVNIRFKRDTVGIPDLM